MKKDDRLEVAPFDASDYLDSEEVIAEYLPVALDNPNPDVFLMAIRDVAKARGISKVAAAAGLGRESLYKALRPGSQPRFETVRRLVEALGVRLDVAPPPSA
jgi:probable addiction module antidote protein